MAITLQDWIAGASLVVGAASLGVAYWQLSDANKTLAAANIISITKESRDIAEQIYAAGNDKARQQDAFDKYGDYLTGAGYLARNGQLPEVMWQRLKSDFCLLYQSESFRVWYARNSKAPHLQILYPSFADLYEDAKCVSPNTP